MRPKRNPAIDVMIDGFDGGDPWGSAMSMAFAVAEVGRAIGNSEPGQTLNYRPSPFGPRTLDEYADNEDAGEDYETETLALAVRQGEVTSDDLTFAARVLHRYLVLLERAGQSY